jgi:3-hexulose-6-phosphate synthase
MKLHVAVDLHTLEKAIAMVHKVAPFVDIIEAGTPLIKQEGLRIISILKECFPEKLILADMKTMDAGGLEAKLAYDAGADLVTVLAVATTPPSEVPWRWPTGEANGWWST